MEIRAFLEDHPFFKKHLLSIATGCVGLVLIVYGLIGYLGQMVVSPQKDPVQFQSTEATSQSKAPTDTRNTILVDVAGSVVNPGVYKLPVGSRIEDAIDAAGGVAADADPDYVAKQLNQAAKIIDGAKIYIPKIGEAQVAGASDGVNQSNGLVNINTATEKDLDTLPGVGAVTAGKIIAGRPYSAPEELTTKKIVTKKVFEGIKDKITLY